MKHFQKIGYYLAILVLIMFLACESETTPPNQESCGDPSDRIMRVSFTLDGRNYDLDSFESLFGSNNFRTNGDTTYADYHRETNSLYYQLKLAWPANDTSATFSWQNSTKYLEGYGCFITTDSLLEKRRFMPTNGSTTIAMYGDTIFGTFCGKLKDSLGGTHDLSNGRFYYISN